MPTWIEPKISIGHIGTTIVVLLSLAMAYQRVQDSIATIQAEVQTARAERKVLELEIRSIREIASARQESIVSRLARIEALLEQLSRLPR